MVMRHSVISALLLSVAVALSAERALAQPDYGTRLGQREGGEVGYRPQGPATLLGSLDASVGKRYMPQELYQEYWWQTWSYTRYAEDPYQRYIDPLLWGDYYYDVFGNYLTRGWLVYNWTQEHPRIAEGSRVLRTGQYGGFFSSLIIAADQQGQYSYSVTVGDEIATTLTPMTFRKAVFNGTQVDFRSDRYAVTGLFSRISAPGFITDPNPISINDFNNLIGGRAQVKLGDYVNVGGTFVSAHTGRGSLESFKGNPFKGALTTAQVQDQVNTIVLRLSDDSPADDMGGAVLLADDVEIRTRIGDRDTVLSGNEIGFTPQKEGGSLREGVRVADGTEQVTLRYELSELMRILDNRDIVNDIRNVRFRLVLANDYRIEITSNSQTNAEGQSVFLLVEQADGNVRDATNKKEVIFDYGLPTANQVFGFTLEVEDLKGFRLYSEFDVNHRFRQYPNRRLDTHRAFSGIAGKEGAVAWTGNLSRNVFPWYLFAEGYYVDGEYNTSTFIVDGRGEVDYEDATRSLYDFVDDNDDQDRKPDQKRLFQDPRTGTERGAAGRSAEGFADEAVFPGWDENNDFISDFNQNNSRYQENIYPDYDEPFLRYASDRPEFLFGVDLNNNGWIDRFENDNEPDYPYKKDRKGYNVFARNHLRPHLGVTLGQQREFLISDDRKNLTTYALLAFESDYAGIGRVRIFDMVKKAEDDIQDDLFQWTQTPGTTGSQQRIADPLAAQDTWINTLWLGYDRASDSGMSFGHKLRYEVVNQRRDAAGLGFKGNTRFLGVIDKVDYLYRIGKLTVRPRFKSEFVKDNTPYTVGRSERSEWSGMFFLVFQFPVLWETGIELGLEQVFFQDLLRKEDRLQKGDLTRDFRNSVLAAQLSNKGDYLGYRLTTQLGFSIVRKSPERFQEDRKSETNSYVFMSMYASLGK